VAFVYDGGEAWYRNSVIRDRALPAANYLDFMQAYDTFDHLASEGVEATMYDNSNIIPTGESARKIVTYKNGKEIYRDRELIKKMMIFDIFKKALRVEQEKRKLYT